MGGLWFSLKRIALDHRATCPSSREAESKGANTMANPWKFLEAWAKENVHATAFGDEATAHQLAKDCLEAAKKAGITEAAITKAAGGNLSDFLLSELESAEKPEKGRLVAKDTRNVSRM